MFAGALLLLAAAVLLNTGLLLQPASAQGLGVAPDLLGAGAQATATAFEEFQDVLNLATVGGRGRGGRGTSGNLGGFSDARDFEQTQAAMYYIAGSSQSYLSKVIGKPRNQRKCLTCVAHAATEAVEMSVASAMHINRALLERKGLTASPISLYYCAPGGRSCNTGWDIPQALRNLEDAPQWLQPNSCMDTALAQEGLREAAVLNWRDMCRKAASQPACTAIKREQPLYTCSYKSLSSFYQIEQHIRRHGSVITRITMPNDWEVQFNSSMRTVKGLDAPPYRYNATAKAAYGHALTIVGFDNQNFTWTLLNSWGSGEAEDNLRVKGGVTADGMVQVRMGLLGVAQPEETYGVACEPATGTKENLHGDRPWLNDSHRRLLTPLPPQDNQGGTCFNYTVGPGDAVASIVDHFDMDIRAFVQHSTNRRLFRLEDFTYKFPFKLHAAEIALVMSTVSSVTQVLSTKPPHFACTGYDAIGAALTAVCNSSSADSNAPCSAPGITSCTLHYKDINVTQFDPGSTVRVCNPNWAKDPDQFYKVAFLSGAPSITDFKPEMPATEAAALVALTQLAVAPLGEFYIEAVSTRTEVVQCFEGPGDIYSWALEGAYLGYAAKCSNVSNADGTRNVTSLYMKAVVPGQLDPSKVHPQLDNFMLYPLLRLQSLQVLELAVFKGTLPPQLGSLRHLRTVIISHYCLTGPLPPFLMRGLPKLRKLYISTELDRTYVNPTGEQCGLSGPIPVQWQTTRSNIVELDLQYNRFSGKLPDITNWSRLTSLSLEHNMFQGEVPLGWQSFFFKVLNRSTEDTYQGDKVMIDISFNLLEGIFPRWGMPLANQAQSMPFRRLILDGNTKLRGCIPVSGYSTVQYADTGISGLCYGDPASIQAAQVSAMNTTFRQLLRYGQVNDAYDVMINSVLAITASLGKRVVFGETRTRFEQGAELSQFNNNPWGSLISVGVEVISGVEYITLIQVQVCALNLTNLPQLAASLPNLKEFLSFDASAINNRYPIKEGELVLPPALPVAAPHLQYLYLANNGILGTLPLEYGNWPSLQKMILRDNYLTGTIPPWSNLSSIQYLHLQRNKLQGTLPAAMGTGSLPNNPEIDFSYNKGITGTIPATWAHFSAASVRLVGTGIVGCIPDGIPVVVRSDNQSDAYPYCSTTNASDALVLSQLKALLVAVGASSSSLDTWDTTPQKAGSTASPRYCRLFKGVACDDNNRVVQLNLTALGMQGQAYPLSLLNITKIISPLSNLQVLVLARLGVSGSVGDVMQTSPNAFPNLAVLDVSGNPGISGPLPDKLAVLTNLRVLDVSGCGISGTLPISFVALQQLREFRAANCTQLSGPLPVDWGMLTKLEVLAVTNSDIIGSLPLEYADYLAMQKVATRASAAAAEAAARAAAVAENLKREMTLAPARGSGDDSLSPRTGRAQAQRRLALNAYTTAQRNAAMAQRVAQAVQAAASNATIGRSSTGLGMLKLRQLLLSGNSLTGSLPVQYAQMRDLQVVNISHNQLVGTIPRVFASLTQLAVLSLGHNQLQSPLPAALVSLRQLAVLDLSNNNFTGAMPSPWQLMAGPGFRLQCLLLNSNTDELVSEEGIRELMTINEARIPQTSLAINNASSPLCSI